MGGYKRPSTLRRYYPYKRARLMRRRLPFNRMRLLGRRRPYYRRKPTYRSARRRTINQKRVTRVVHRHYKELTPKTGGSPQASGFIGHNCRSTWAILNELTTKDSYYAIFDEVKLGRCYYKFYLKRAGKALTDEDDTLVKLWSCYDDDGGGSFTPWPDAEQFRKHPSSKWKLLKPWQIHTVSLSPHFTPPGIPHKMSGTSRSFRNPWYDIADIPSHSSSNCIQIGVEGPTRSQPGDPPEYTLCYEFTQVIYFRGLRNGQQNS